MSVVWGIAASNTAVVAMLAVGVALLGRVWKNPAGLHLLWVLVLVKLVTPPVVTVPLPHLADRPGEQPSASLEDRANQGPTQPGDIRPSEEMGPAAGLAAPDHHGPEHRPVLAERIARQESGATTGLVAPAATTREIPWLTVLAWLWGIGVALVATGHARRIFRFRRLVLAGAVPSPAVQNMAERIGKRLGLRRVPEVLMLPLRFSPLVWSAGSRLRIVLPAELFERLDPEAQEAILAHELAHVRRKDHWVRLLELVVGTLFWWHPAVWYASRQLRELEEQCCDGLVLGTLPHGGRAYATALLDTLDFLSGSSLALPSPATGVKSSLSLARRIRMLKNHTPVVRLTFGRLLLIMALAALPMAAGFAKEAPKAKDNGAPKASQKPAEQPKKPAEAPKPAQAAPSAESITYHCKVLDGGTKRPIEGATVTVLRRVSDNSEPFPKWRKLGETKHVTDAEGRYAFTVPPEQGAEKYLYVEIEADQPNYLHFYGGYGFGMIRENEKLGERPFFERLELAPAEQLVGKVVKPDGSPAAGVHVSDYSQFDPKDFHHGFWSKAETDQEGVFRIKAILAGKTVLWIVPKDYSPSTQIVDRDFARLVEVGGKLVVAAASRKGKHDIEKFRRDVGRFVLEEGIRIQGRVVDKAGKAVAGVWVDADLQSGPAKKQIGMPVVDYLRRSVLTGADGRFDMRPLPPGTYRVTPFEEPVDALVDDRSPHPLPAVFLPQTAILEKGAKTKEIEFRAVPTVKIVTQYYDSSGKTRSGSELHLSGRLATGLLQKDFYWRRCPPDANGRIMCEAPKGPQDARLQLITNEHSALRSRVSKDAPLKNSRSVELGTLDHDMTEIGILRYAAPNLVVKAVDQGGKLIAGAEPKIKFAADRAPSQGEYLRDGKPAGDVSFEHQDDGRWRSSQLLPDEDFTLTVEAPGYKPSSQKLRLAEGATKELEVKLEKQ